MKGAPIILIIDNESQTRRLLRINLEGRGYEVKEAIIAQEGIRLASTVHPDLI